MQIDKTAMDKKGIELKDVNYAVPFIFVNDEDQMPLRQGVFMKVEHQDGFFTYIVNLLNGMLYVLDVDYESEDEDKNENPTFCDCDEVIPLPNSILKLQR